MGRLRSGHLIGQEHYSGTETYSFDDCGFTLNGVSTFSGTVHFRAVKGGEAFLVVNDNYSFRDVLTNPDTGKRFVVRGNGAFHETKATHVTGNIYEFTALESGQPFVLEDAARNVIVRDRGVIRHTACSTRSATVCRAPSSSRGPAPRFTARITASQTTFRSARSLPS